MVPFHRELPAGYEIHRFGDSDAVSVEDVLDLWRRETVMTEEVAAARVKEVLLVATGPAGELAGITTAYLQRNPQIRLDVWYQRFFVAESHRLGYVGAVLGWQAIELLEARYVSGEDQRGVGIAHEFENLGVRAHYTAAVLQPGDFAFIGENARGDHVRVRYFPGVLAPPPPWT
ncbi:MAG: hypothetical protein QOH68_4253 [Nocardioidaceae bacterium]|nr:hypothetical protein [Nocardioidaceae bacterium]